MSEFSPAEEEQLAGLVGSIQDRMNAGERVDLEEIKHHFPRFADDLDSYFNCGSFLQQAFGDSDVPSPSVKSEELRLDLKAFPIERRLPDVALGTVYLLGRGQLEQPRELVVLRAWFTPKERESIEADVRHALTYQGEGFIPIIDMGRLNQVPFVLREHFPGRNLGQVFEEVLDCGGALGFDNVMQGEVGEGVSVAPDEAAAALLKNDDHMDALLAAFQAWAFVLDQGHRRGLVHREIEPRNLSIAPDGECAVGGAGLVWHESGIDMKRMRDWCPHWLAPEVADPSWGNVTWLADVYSLARGLAACLSLRVPTPVENPEEVLMHISVGDRTWLDELPAQLDPRLREILEEATFPDPSRRTKSLAHFGKKIAAFVKNDKGRARLRWSDRIFGRS